MTSIIGKAALALLLLQSLATTNAFEADKIPPTCRLLPGVTSVLPSQNDWKEWARGSKTSRYESTTLASTFSSSLTSLTSTVSKLPSSTSISFSTSSQSTLTTSSVGTTTSTSSLRTTAIPTSTSASSMPSSTFSGISLTTTSSSSSATTSSSTTTSSESSTTSTTSTDSTTATSESSTTSTTSSTTTSSALPLQTAKLSCLPTVDAFYLTFTSPEGVITRASVGGTMQTGQAAVYSALFSVSGEGDRFGLSNNRLFFCQGSVIRYTAAQLNPRASNDQVYVYAPQPSTEFTELEVTRTTSTNELAFKSEEFGSSLFSTYICDGNRFVVLTGPSAGNSCVSTTVGAQYITL